MSVDSGGAAASGVSGRRPGMLIIFVTVMLNSIGFGIIVPVMPQLLGELTGEALADGARIGGYLLFVYALMQFLFSPLIGNLSDRFGRRPVLLLSLFCLAIDYLIIALAPTLAWLFAGRMLSGIAGATYVTANAYVADISTPQTRAQNFGLLGAAFGLGFVFGPVIGGFLGEYGARVPFFGAAALSLAAFVYGHFAVPESLAESNRRAFRWQRASPLGALRSLRGQPLALLLAIAFFLYQLGHNVMPATWSFFTIERFGWSAREVGYSLGAVGILMAVVQGYLTRIVIDRHGMAPTATVCAALAVVAYVGYALAPSGVFIYLVMVPGAVSAMLGPALNGMLSVSVPANAQGELQGALASLTGIASIVGPVVMTQAFGYFTGDTAPFYLPGAAFLLAGLLGAGCLLMILRARALPVATDCSATTLV